MNTRWWWIGVLIITSIIGQDCLAQSPILRRFRVSNDVYPSHPTALHNYFFKDKSGRYWYLGSQAIDSNGKWVDSISQQVFRQISPGMGTGLDFEMLEFENMVGRDGRYGYRWGFNPKAREWDPLAPTPPAGQRQYKARRSFWNFWAIGGNGDTVYVVGPRVDRFSISKNRWLEPIEYWESEPDSQPTMRFFTTVQSTPTGVYIGAYSEYTDPYDWRKDKYWFELYKLDGDRLTPLLRRPTTNSRNLFVATADGRKGIVWARGNLFLSQIDNPIIIDFMSMQTREIVIPWSRILEDIEWLPLPGSIVICGKYAYLFNEVLGRQKQDMTKPDPANRVIIRYNLEEERIESITEPRIRQSYFTAVADNKIVLSINLPLGNLPPQEWYIVQTWKDWEAGEFTPLGQAENDVLSAYFPPATLDTLRYITGTFNCCDTTTEVLVSNINKLWYLIDVQRFFDTSGVPREIYTTIGIVYPNPVTDETFYLRVGEQVANISLNDMQGKVKHCQWQPLGEGMLMCSSSQLASGIYQLNILYENGRITRVPIVVLR